MNDECENIYIYFISAEKNSQRADTVSIKENVLTDKTYPETTKRLIQEYNKPYLSDVQLYYPPCNFSSKDLLPSPHPAR